MQPFIMATLLQLNRQPDAWASDDTVNALQLFIDKVVQNEAKYNFSGILSFKNRKEELHEANIQEKLESFFNGQLNYLRQSRRLIG